MWGSKCGCKSKSVSCFARNNHFPINHDPLKIKKAKIRGVESNGMICAEDEIGIGENHDGIMVLSGNYKAGDQAKIVFDVKETPFLNGLTPNRADAMSHYGVAEILWLL